MISSFGDKTWPDGQTNMPSPLCVHLIYFVQRPYQLLQENIQRHPGGSLDVFGVCLILVTVSRLF